MKVCNAVRQAGVGMVLVLWALVLAAGAQSAPDPQSAPAPSSPFTDFRYEKPGQTRKISLADLPAPHATESSANQSRIVPRPADAWPQAPAGFKVELFATDLSTPRYMVTAPNGDVFLAESHVRGGRNDRSAVQGGNIRIFRGITSDGKPMQSEVFASGLVQPYGIAFYPPGNNPSYVYVATTSEVVRFPYHRGDLKATGAAEHIADLPNTGGHWTRDVVFSKDGKQMFVSVGSRSNNGDADDPAEKNRADILVMNPDGSNLHVYASGIRNSGGGIAINPQTGELWCATNERDDLGDNLVPDYITHVQENGFYGWPWYYMGGHPDPDHAGQHPELKDKVLTPDVILQPHGAPLEITFYDGKQFPSQYRGDLFGAEHGSWNRSVRSGYEVIRVPLQQKGHSSGEYEDFLTGFVLPNGTVWGRPVGVTTAPDGSLLVSDDASNSVWRVSYAK